MNFNEFVEKNYYILKKKWIKYLQDKGEKFDEDIYHSTIIQVMQKADNLADKSEKGYANYLFKSFQNNIKREKLYHCNLLRDINYDDDAITTFLESQHDESFQDKVMRDTYISFVTNVILSDISDNFDLITFSVFRIYILNSLTYQRLCEITKVKDCKKRISSVKRYLKEKYNKKILFEKFLEFYDN